MPRVIGQIEADMNGTGVHEVAWLALIASHPQLEHAPSRLGINPFTKQPAEFKVPETTAIITVDGERKGSISWAMDGSPMLIVNADEQDFAIVERLAEEIASSLGGRFVWTR